MERLVGQLVAAIRKHRPQVVLCDNQFGGYGHPDHIKLHRATMQAATAAADPAQYPEAGPAHQVLRVYHPAFGFKAFRLLVRLMPVAGRDPRKFGKNHDIDLTEVVQWETPVHARIDVRRYVDVKMAAGACHRSQGGPMEMAKGMPRWLRDRVFGFEGFTQGFPATAGNGRMTNDLFPG
jgi:LmbE family N-acetylglucosaminyl deacetylase